MICMIHEHTFKKLVSTLLFALSIFPEKCEETRPLKGEIGCEGYWLSAEEGTSSVPPKCHSSTLRLTGPHIYPSLNHAVDGALWSLQTTASWPIQKTLTTYRSSEKHKKHFPPGGFTSSSLFSQTAWFFLLSKEIWVKNRQNHTIDFQVSKHLWEISSSWWQEGKHNGRPTREPSQPGNKCSGFGPQLMASGFWIPTQGWFAAKPVCQCDRVWKEAMWCLVRSSILLSDIGNYAPSAVTSYDCG